MSDLDALLRAVIDRPDDDTPREVYADCLEDMGDPVRAAFIRAQVELARTPAVLKPGTVTYSPAGVATGLLLAETPNPKCTTLQAEAAALFKAMPGDQKCIRGGDGLTAWIVQFDEPRQWSRGFPEVCRDLHSTFWRDHHAELRAAAPIRRVELVDRPALHFGGITGNRIVDHDGSADLIDEWDVTWGQHTARCVSKTHLSPEVMRSPNEPAAIVERERHLDRTRTARTVLGFFEMKWPGVRFVLPPLPSVEPDYRTLLRQMDDQILRSLGVPPALVWPDPRFRIRTDL